MNIIQVYKQFPTQESCIRHLEQIRWNGKPTCPYCKSSKHSPMKDGLRYHCNSCNTSYSVTVGTIFHKTHVDLQKWFLAVSMMINALKGMSARQLARDIEVNKNTAWYMAMRIRRAMLTNGDLLRGIVEMDETYIGGKPRKGATKKGTLKRGRGTNKTSVVGMIERGGDVVARVSGVLNSKRLMSLVRQNVDCDDATLMTDEYRAYSPMHRIISHKSVDHQTGYVNGNIHTNSIEGFWALLKRGIVGQYHKVSVKHLQRYIDEFAYRFNNRRNPEIFNMTILQAVGV